ncbi:hypothetical protein roselon_02497 [Roseibacterium elongatum DSM 19469]|uniref:Uncharacterized protein n=1 Tax=Roseicyclus elongatus DSM 19469 TaxID=1294273 RepID=W8RUB0_9RHOB|nr:hypothetical protein [Roseibacterium elongatum]AHM04818.1 hypothetical protein roselon_02497 [Roseibacterium elongatum DSM 19469]
MPPLDPIAIVEAIATVFWTYAAIGAGEWLWRVRRTEASSHIPHVTDLIANLVPAMIALVVIVLAGAFFGLPTVVVVIAVLFPAGLAFGVHMSLNDLRDTAHWQGEVLRLALVLIVAAVVIWYRQLR